MALAPDDGDSRAYLSIARDGDPTAAPTLKVVLYSDANIPSGPVHLHAAGVRRRCSGALGDDDSIAAVSKDPALIAALVRLGESDAKALQVSIGKASVSLSLSGAAGGAGVDG